ncbi:acyltransferase [Janthinobacterium sp. FW305-128]|uniref:acyltransferase family protein n=1 Tax=Janthinobacterium sp. FW305-128 TaxID=2775055 RepID=UPI001E3BFD47|nr:acyltransferase [Janthinobacterium sp. FW305-128]MCC7681801.1 acyltransferase [Janthinobacterium sp. FW305-128]
MSFSSSSSRLYGLDTLRALAIVLVFMNHYLLFVSDGGAFGFWGEIGWTGVDLFFALSGYLIGNQIFTALRSEHGFSLSRFYARRFLRTLPNFYVVLALYYLWPAFRGDSALLPLWKFLTFTQNINLTPGTAFSHAWSLCVEEQFYVLLPAVALAIAACRKSLLWAWLAMAASLIVGMLVRAYLWDEYVQVPRGGLGYYKYIYYASWCRFDELVAGVALALLKNYHPTAWARLTSYGNRTLLAGIGGTALMFYVFLTDHYGYAVTVFGYPALAASFTLLLVAALSPGSTLYKLRVPGAASLALWSYAIYLLHKQLCILLRPVLQDLGHGPDGAPAILLSAAVSILTGWLLYRVVETPFMRLRARYVPANHA